MLTTKKFLVLGRSIYVIFRPQSSQTTLLMVFLKESFGLLWSVRFSYFSFKHNFECLKICVVPEGSEEQIETIKNLIRELDDIRRALAKEMFYVLYLVSLEVLYPLGIRFGLADPSPPGKEKFDAFGQFGHNLWWHG